jgi:hypothetical protein
MRITLFILFFSFLIFISCKKENDSDNNQNQDYPTSVTFTYNGSTVTYNVIKKIYYKDLNGNLLSTPITKLWLDRNIGAERVATTECDSLAAGDLFQWGRMADGHQNKYSDTIEQLSNTITPNHNKFIAMPLNPTNDWLILSDDSLWHDSQNTNCSCPTGWRVPTIEELGMEMNSWNPKTLPGAFASPLKWTSGGDRDNWGTLRYTNWMALIWSSTPGNSGEANSLVIPGIDSAEVLLTPRIYGASVRCIKDY